MKQIFRWVLVVTGIVTIILAAGFFLQSPWATQIWPVESSRLSNIFVSSILAAIGAPIVWIGLNGETRAMTGGAINLLVTNGGFSVSALAFYAESRQPALLLFTIATIPLAFLSLGLAIYGHRRRFADPEPFPWILRGSFALFALVLLATSAALILRRPNTFPWPLSGENSVLYGWIFLGAMCYFIYAVIFPAWSNARGQLLGFLAYDLVLIGPFLAHFGSVKPEMRTSLTIYTAVLIYSGLLAIYFLFIHPASRFRMSSPAKAETQIHG